MRVWNCNVEIAILRSKKEFSKKSSLVTRNAVNYCDIEDYSFDSPHTTRHLTRHPDKGILLIINILGARFTLSPLVTLKKGDEWISLATCYISRWYTMWGWRVGDEWNEMNHRRNNLYLSTIRRFGWRVDECCKNSTNYLPEPSSVLQHQ